MKKYLSKKYLNYWLGSGVVVIILGMFVFGGGKEDFQTLVVKEGPFIQQISVSGKVVASQSVDLAFTQSGRVSAVYAKVGEIVYAGKTLASLDNGDLWADVLQKEATLGAEKAKLDALVGGTREEQLEITESSVSAALTVRDQAIRALADEVKNAYTQSDDAIRRRVDQFISNPRSSAPTLTITTEPSLKSKIEWQRYIIEGILTGWNDDIVTNRLSSGDLVELSQKNLHTVLDFLGDIATSVNTAGSSASLSQTTLDGYRTDVTTARANINTAISSLSQALTAKKNAEADLVTVEKRLALERAGTDSGDISIQEARVKAAEADVLSARARYQKTLVTAPFSGVITKMDAKVGGIASANSSAISMISMGNFQIESYIPEINLPFISVGDVATVTLDAYGIEAPFDALVVSIDPAETVRDGVTTYKSILEFIAKDDRIRAGMTANVIITTEQKDSAISIPQGIIVKKDGQVFVPVLENKEVVLRPVITGSVSSLGSVEILSGLTTGDVVVIEQE